MVEGALTACGTASARAAAPAAPTVQQPIIEMRFQSNDRGVPWNQAMRSLDQPHLPRPLR
jgi:hypothetical protein